MEYTTLDKAMAVEIVARNNGVLDTITLAAIREALGQPDLKHQTVRYWLKTRPAPSLTPNILSEEKNEAAEQHRQAVEVTQKVQQALDVKLEQAAHAFVDHATRKDTIGDMSGQQAMTAAGIAIDKMRILRGLPTEIVAVLPGLVNALQDNGIDATEFFKMALAKARAARGIDANR